MQTQSYTREPTLTPRQDFTESYQYFRSENQHYPRQTAFSASEKIQKTETPKQDEKQQKIQG